MRYFLIFVCFAVSVLGEDFRENIHFIVYKDNVPYNTSEYDTRDPVLEGLCQEGDQLAVITHGWTWSCTQDWVIEMVAKLTVHRGDCIICMDYSHYAKNLNYLVLVAQFNDIRQVLYDQMVVYGNAGLDPIMTFMFGFSYGAHLVLQAAAMLRRLQGQLIKQIDICDPAGPGFTVMPDAKDSAQNVQCLHTSIDKGTTYRNCHQDWLMGHCGISQDSAQPAELIPILPGNHETCPHFYNSAFDNDFPAIPKPNSLLCLLSPESTSYPENFKMGYSQENKKQVQGILYARTTRNYPFN